MNMWILLLLPSAARVYDVLLLNCQKEGVDSEAEHGPEPPAAGESSVREGPPLARDTALQRFHVSSYHLA